MYYDGLGVSRNREMSVEWLRKSAEQGITQAQIYLGEAYEKAEGVNYDRQQALKWYMSAADAGSIEAYYKIGAMLSNSNYNKGDFSECIRYLLIAADKNHMEAQNLLGQIYETGLYANQKIIDLVEAQKFYRKSANLGLAKSQYALGMLYRDGKGLPEDLTEAMKWFQKSALQNNSDAMYQIGRFYAEGEGVQKNKKIADYWYKKSYQTMIDEKFQNANNGDIGDIIYIAKAFAEGKDGFPKDADQAFIYFKMGAEQENIFCEKQLGLSYLKGIGIKRDSREAEKWLAKIIQYYKEQIIIHPKEAHYYVDLGIALGYLERWNESIVAFEQAEKASPYILIGNTEALQSLVSGRTALGQTDKVLELHKRLRNWEEALRINREKFKNNPYDYKVLNEIAGILSEMKKPLEAIETYKQSIKLAPNNSDTWSYLAGILDDQKKYSESADAYRKCLKLNSNNNVSPYLYYDLGMVLNKSKRYQDAADAFRESVKLSPEFNRAWPQLGLVYIQLNRPKDASEACKQGLKYEQIYPEYWTELGKVFAKLKAWEDVIKCYERAVKYKGNSSAMYELGYAYFKTGNKTAGLEIVERLRKEDTEKADKLFNLLFPK